MYNYGLVLYVGTIVNCRINLFRLPFRDIRLVRRGRRLRVACASIFHAVLIFLVRSQSESARKLLSADSARVLHLVDVCVRLHFVTDQIRHLVEALAAEIALVRPLVRVCEHVITQVAWKKNVYQRL